MGANARSRSPASASRRATRANDAEGDDEGDDDDAREIARLQRERRALDDATTTSRDARKGDDALDDERNDAREATTRATRTVKAPPRAYAPTAETLAGAPLDAEEDEDLESDEALGFGKSRRVIDRESDYSKRRFKRRLSPGKKGEVRGDETRGRRDAREARFWETTTTRDRGRRARCVRLTENATQRAGFASTQDGDEGRSYAERMKEAAVERERDNTLRNIEKKQREEAERAADEARLAAARASEPAASSARP